MRTTSCLLVLTLAAVPAGRSWAGDPPASEPKLAPPAGSAPAAPPRPPLPPGVLARVGTHEVTRAEFHVALARAVKDELETPESGPANVLQHVLEETVVALEAARLGISVSNQDYEVRRKQLDDELREKSNGTQTLDDVITIKGLTAAEFRLRLEDIIRKERIAGHPSYLGASLPKDERQRVAQIELVMAELMKKAKVERTGLPEGTFCRINGQSISEEAFGAALDMRLAITEVKRHLQQYCFTLLLGDEAKKITDAEVAEELEAARPLWQHARDEAVDPQVASMTFEAFLQMRFNAPLDELKKSPYRRGIFALRRRVRASIKPDEVRAAWVRGATNTGGGTALYGESIAVTDLVVGFRASSTVAETVKRRDREEAMRVVRDYERRLRSGESAAAIEKEIKAAKTKGELSGVIYGRRVLINGGNDLLLFEKARPLGRDGEWSAPIELQSEVHLLRRDALRPAPKFELVEAVVRERLVDERAAQWISERSRDEIQIAAR